MNPTTMDPLVDDLRKVCVECVQCEFGFDQFCGAPALPLKRMVIPQQRLFVGMRSCGVSVWVLFIRLVQEGAILS